ncbi:hypothetical protein QFZ64_002361 [Streptomyces sp. B3I8]|nr:hypothetical protein [Streptomyces sp. B3I8]
MRCGSPRYQESGSAVMTRSGMSGRAKNNQCHHTPVPLHPTGPLPAGPGVAGARRAAAHARPAGPGPPPMPAGHDDTPRSRCRYRRGASPTSRLKAVLKALSEV